MLGEAAGVGNTVPDVHQLLGSFREVGKISYRSDERDSWDEFKTESGYQRGAACEL